MSSRDPSKRSPSRRDFLRDTTAASAALAAAPLTSAPFAFAGGDAKLRVLSIGVVGTIGGRDRTEIHNHPDTEIVGLCDVDSNALAKAKEMHPDASSSPHARVPPM